MHQNSTANLRSLRTFLYARRQYCSITAPNMHNCCRMYSLCGFRTHMPILYNNVRIDRDGMPRPWKGFLRDKRKGRRLRDDPHDMFP